MATAEVCRKHGISGATFYKWKAKYGGLDVSDARRLKALDDENACHAVHANEIDSRVEQATPFQIVADVSGMTPNALTAWLQTSHPTIPSIIM
jgi:hypothetical protein